MDTRVYLTNKEKRVRFKDKFAYNPDNGVRKLTADGCNKKYDLTREEVYLSDKENRKRNFEGRNSAEYDESKMQNMLVKAFNKGFKLLNDESADDFIKRVVDDGYGEEIGYEAERSY